MYFESSCVGLAHITFKLSLVENIWPPYIHKEAPSQSMAPHIKSKVLILENSELLEYPENLEHAFD